MRYTQVADEQRFKVKDAAKALGCGQTKLRELIADRKIGSFMLGRQIFIPGSEINRIQAECYRPAIDSGAEASNLLAGSSIHRQAKRKAGAA